jgi:hypothetical protein
MMGKIEKLIIYLIGELEAESYYVPRSRLSQEILNYYIDHDGPLQANQNAHKAVISRALTSLIEKGFVYGYYQAWHRFSGMNSADKYWGWQSAPGIKGRKKKSGEYCRPRLQYINLTDKGHEYFKKLTS